MIPFLKPYLDTPEITLLQSHHVLETDVTDAIETISRHLNHVNYVITASGEEAIGLAIRHTKEQHHWNWPTIAIPSVCCGSVYRPAKKEGAVILMDAGYDWNCVYDNDASQADIILFASLGGLRVKLPEKRKNQVFIDDAAQCFDYTCGLRPEADYGIFSFGNGKQMFASGGGLLCSHHHTLNDHTNIEQLSSWQIVLMASQLNKIEEINAKSIHIGKSYIHHLKSLTWLRIPSYRDNCFSKFVVFIHQTNVQPPGKIPGRTDEIWRFIQYMAQHGIQVEETYIPLHIRFPDEFNNLRYQHFKANHLWMEAITLPCRPNMTSDDIQSVLNAVKNFHPALVTNHNRQTYEHKYMPLEKPTKKFFRNLYESRLRNIQNLARNRNRCIDLGCGNGLHMIPLIANGIHILGLDFSDMMLKSFKAHCNQPVALLNSDIQNIALKDNTFDMAYSIATLYYVPDTEKAIQEIYRILRPGGVAYLEFGNQNSLNHFEAKRVSTGAISVHVDISWLYSYLEKIGFTIFDTERFQIFPLYGNMINNSIQSYFEISHMHNNHVLMLDEWVANAPFLSRYAFRYGIYISKGPHNPVIYSRQLLEPVDFWTSRDRENQRLKAICQPLNQQLKSLCQMMADDPTDPLTFHALAKLHVQTQEEHDFVNQIKVDIDHYIQEKQCS